MHNHLKKVEPKTLRLIRWIGREADRREIPAYLVGGMVRDILLNKKNLDVDIVLEGDAIAFARDITRGRDCGLTVYKEFGTATIRLPSGRHLDLATARREVYPYPGALPDVKPGVLEDDLFRRDFSINAVAMSINAAAFGEPVDAFGGLADLKAKKVRILHEQSFVDDPTRILRAVRFEQRLGFRIEAHTLGLLKKALAAGAPATVKPPRYFAEFKKILLEARPLPGLKRLKGLKALRFLGAGARVPAATLGLLQKKLMLVKGRHPYYNQCSVWTVYLMALLEGAGVAGLEEMAKRFQLSRQDKQALLDALRGRGLLRKLASVSLSASQAYRLLKPLRPEAVLYLHLKAFGSKAGLRIARFAGKDYAVTLGINGKDIQKLGVRSGAMVGTILQKVLCGKIDREIKSRRDELNAARKLAAKA